MVEHVLSSSNDTYVQREGRYGRSVRSFGDGKPRPVEVLGVYATGEQFVITPTVTLRDAPDQQAATSSWTSSTTDPDGGQVTGIFIEARRHWSHHAEAHIERTRRWGSVSKANGRANAGAGRIAAVTQKLEAMEAPAGASLGFNNLLTPIIKDPAIY
jgi:hypothetical protein